MKSENFNIGAVVVIGALVLICAGVAFVVTSGQSGKDYDAVMTQLVDKYFKDNVSGKIIGISRHEITLKSLADDWHADIGVLRDCDMERSKAYIIIENPQETDMKKVKYKIENELACEK